MIVTASQSPNFERSRMVGRAGHEPSPPIVPLSYRKTVSIRADMTYNNWEQASFAILVSPFGCLARSCLLRCPVPRPICLPESLSRIGALGKSQSTCSVKTTAEILNRNGGLGTS
jgi:hypothetical protein